MDGPDNPLALPWAGLPFVLVGAHGPAPFARAAEPRRVLSPGVQRGGDGNRAGSGLGESGMPDAGGEVDENCGEPDGPPGREPRLWSDPDDLEDSED